MNVMPKKIRVPDLALMKERHQPVVVLTAYDATMARLFDQSGVDILLVDGSLGNVILGLDTTIGVARSHDSPYASCFSGGASRALIVADMPFLTYQVTPEEALRNAARLFQQGGAAAVKLEGGGQVADIVRRLTGARLPVMGHLGLTPQHVHQLGGMRRQATSESAADELLRDAFPLKPRVHSPSYSRPFQTPSRMP